MKNIKLILFIGLLGAVIVLFWEHTIYSCAQWHSCRLDYNDQMLVRFNHANMEYSLRMIRIINGSDCSKMWGGFPSMQEAYVAVSLESADEVYPLGGLSGGFLNIHKVIDTPSGVTILGGDGGGAWRAFCCVDQGLKVKSISDERVILKFFRM